MATTTRPRTTRRAPTAAPSAATAAPAPAATNAAPAEPDVKLKKVPMVRDSFTMPEAEYTLIAALKARSLQSGRSAKKSELLRAGLQLLTRLDDAALSAALEALPPIKVGRPKKSR